MEKIKLCFLTLILAIIFQNVSFAQLNKIGTMLASGADDASQLVEAYTSPYLNALGASMSGGWYNTAKAHKTLGFDLTFTLNTSIVPEMYRTFDVAELDLQTLTLTDPNDNISPTLAGKKEAGPSVGLNAEPYNTTFNLPQGANNRFIPAPMIQLGIGIVKNTEIIGRYVPDMKVGAAKVGMWGIGLKHDLLQHLPVAEKLPVLNISILGGYTKLTSNVGFMVTPEDIGLSASIPGYDASDWDNQSLEFVVKSFTMNLLISADLPVVTFYGGAGFANTKASLKLNGDFPTLDASGISTITDPLDLEIKNKDGGFTKPRLNAGIKFKMAVVTIHFDYTRANYDVVTAGLGISFR